MLVTALSMDVDMVTRLREQATTAALVPGSTPGGDAGGNSNSVMTIDTSHVFHSTLDTVSNPESKLLNSKP